MPTVQETATGQTPLAAALAAGLEDIDYSQTVEFTLYRRVVLPLDGFVFWLRTSALQSRRRAALPNVAMANATRPNEATGCDVGASNGFSAESNDALLNEVTPNQPRIATAPIITPSGTMIVKGSLHWSSQAQQQEDNSGASDTAIFTAESEVNDLDEVAPDEMFIARRGDRLYAFSSSLMRYDQAGLWHYRGQALNPQVASQVVDDPIQLRPLQAVVSNSLPIWIAFGTNQQDVPLFPSFAIPPNQPPPYAAVHIPDEYPDALQALALRSTNSTDDQLVKDRVRFTTYGLRADQALDFRSYLLGQAEDDACPYGLMNMPVMRDRKVLQVEFQVLGQCKTFELEISYYQTRARDVARQLIEHAAITVSVADISISA